jgi:two-component system, OmpR family, sensor histidine kinase BaeS
MAMFKILRNRLIFSHILPLLIIIPMVGVSLIYVLENWVYLPSLSNELQGDSRFLAQISAMDEELWKDPTRAKRLLTQQGQTEHTRFMLITQDGKLAASSDPADSTRLGLPVDTTDFQEALTGQEVKRIISNNQPFGDAIDIFTPVFSEDQKLLGVIRLTYHYETIADEFFQLRFLIGALLVFGLVLGSLIGVFLAISIEAPVRNVTQAVDDLAHGARTQLLAIYGPDEIQKLSLAVNLLVSRLQELEKARKQLLANLVHEVARPLGALRSAIQALAHGAEKDPAFYNELVLGMDDEAARLERLLEDLAQLYDQALGTLELDRKPLLLMEWLPGILRTWQEAAAEKSLEWAVNVSQSWITVQADPARLAQIVGNLVSNAIKFTPPGGQVTISTCLENEMAGISVSDSGPGIANGEQEKIFEPFYRGSQGHRLPEGMGLGLSIAKDLAEAHGGRIEIRSAAGKGSCFTVWLPGSIEPNNSQNG